MKKIQKTKLKFSVRTVYAYGNSGKQLQRGNDTTTTATLTPTGFLLNK